MKVTGWSTRKTNIKEKKKWSSRQDRTKYFYLKGISGKREKVYGLLKHFSSSPMSE
jgi:hypothetical protein